MEKKYLSDTGLDRLATYLQTDDVTIERAANGSLKLSTGQTVWYGHRADWEALSPTEKAKYGIVIFDDDGTTITIDSALSTTSENPVQNKVITVELNKKVDTEDLSAVATSGSYNDLSNKPTIPTKTSDLTNDSDFVASTDLATVATSGSYNDLANKPTIPTKTSDLTNDSDFVKSTDLATVATSGSYNDLSNKPTIDSALSSTSTNAVQNKVIKGALDRKQDTLTNPLTQSDIVDNLTSDSTTAPLSAKQGKALKTLVDGKQNALTNPLTQSDVVDKLTSTSSTLPLSAKQGKTLNDKFANYQPLLTNPLTKADVVNGLTSTVTNVPLSAAQGKVLNDKFANYQPLLTNPLTKSDVVNNLTTTTTNVPLSAAQGKNLNTNKQPKTLATPLTLGGQQYTTVESFLGAVKDIVQATSYWNGGA